MIQFQILEPTRIIYLYIQKNISKIEDDYQGLENQKFIRMGLSKPIEIGNICTMYIFAILSYAPVKHAKNEIVNK